MRKTYFLALAIVIAIGAWMATGDVIVGGEGAASPTAPGETAAEERAPRVATRVFEAGERVAKVDARGRTEADQRVDLRAQVDGLVEVLLELARSRQVIVFSHDDRFASAVRRAPKDVPIKILEIVREAEKRGLFTEQVAIQVAKERVEAARKN